MTKYDSDDDDDDDDDDGLCCHQPRCVKTSNIYQHCSRTAGATRQLLLRPAIRQRLRPESETQTSRKPGKLIKCTND